MRPLGPHSNVFQVAEAFCSLYAFVVAACGPLGRITNAHVLIVETKTVSKAHLTSTMQQCQRPKNFRKEMVAYGFQMF